MKMPIHALCAAVVLAASSIAFPVTAAATTYLQCAVTPGGTASNGYESGLGGWACSTNIANGSYAVSLAVTGLPPGTYTFQWSDTVYSGSFPSVSSCSTSTCGQEVSSGVVDHDEQVSVIVTDTSTNIATTYYAYPGIDAVCVGGIHGPGYHFC